MELQESQPAAGFFMVDLLATGNWERSKASFARTTRYPDPVVHGQWPWPQKMLIYSSHEAAGLSKKLESSFLNANFFELGRMKQPDSTKEGVQK